MIPSGSDETDASNAQVSPVQVTVNEATGRVSASVKVRPRVTSLCPSPSVTIRIAAYVLPLECPYVCTGAGPEPVEDLVGQDGVGRRGHRTACVWSEDTFGSSPQAATTTDAASGSVWTLSRRRRMVLGIPTV